MRLFRDEFKENPKNIHNLEEKLINHLIVNGKKTLAQKIVKDANFSLILRFQKINSRNITDSKDSLNSLTSVTPRFLNQLLLKAIDHGAPTMIIRSRRRGSQKLKVPFPIRTSQRYSTALRWIVTESRRKAKNPKKFSTNSLSIIGNALADTVFETALGKGAVVKRVQNLSRDIYKSRGNSYLRWLLKPTNISISISYH